MNRRHFLSRTIAAAAALVAVGRMPKPAAASETDQARSLYDAMLANPDQYPELWAQVREMAGEVSEVLPTLMPGERWMIDPASQVTNAVADDLYCRACDEVFHARSGKTRHDEIAHGPLTFEAMQADCASRGHKLGTDGEGWTEHYTTVEGGYQWAYFEHWDRDHQGVGPTDHLARVATWRRSLHEQDVADVQATCASLVKTVTDMGWIAADA